MDFQILAKGIALAGCAIGAGCALIDVYKRQPFTLHSIAEAIFFPSLKSKSTFVTSVLNWKSTPAASRYFCMGRIRDSY